ncbi:S-adenosylmethionine:tRNA ribosyltransferase-isomerase [Bacteroidia bacterium]|nr:S-adenosylmethionine:tRNA ribosyltransferase-isomerase [Bacteroidia bacterium]
MNRTQNIRIEEYNYILPEEHIAKYPLPQRDRSKLLVYRDGTIDEDLFFNLVDHLPENALLVFNNTRVIQARMLFQKETGAQIEIFCLEPKVPSDYNLSFSQTETCSWLCFIGNAKRWKDGILKKNIRFNGQNFELNAEKLESYGESHLIKFSWNNIGISFAEILDICGELPIPPYLNRRTEEGDKQNYQTVYSRIKGSVAAPTAGLHFTDEVFDSLKQKRIEFEELTLHVGAGTFKPVKSGTIADHHMHSECFTVKKETLEHLLNKEVPVIAVGTTSVRTLESLYYLGSLLEKDENTVLENIEVGQWMPYNEENNKIPTGKAILNILSYLNKKGLSSLTTHTQIMIAPGYEFKIVNGIITNFHQPQSTLLLLISAFLKGNWKQVYDYALEHDFRFLSYGDSSLLIDN